MRPECLFAKMATHRLKVNACATMRPLANGNYFGLIRRDQVGVRTALAVAG